MGARLVRPKSCANAKNVTLTRKAFGGEKPKNMRNILAFTIALLGCAGSADSLDDPAESTTHRKPAAPTALQCAEECDCFDNNPCTTDACVNGNCTNNPREGYCGDTVGWCRGESCCTGEYTCFRAYDNGNECATDAP